MRLGLTVLWVIAVATAYGQVEGAGGAGRILRHPTTSPSLPQNPAALTSSEVKPEDLAAIEGTVRNSANGQPVRKAELTLRRGEPRPGSQVPAMFTTTTDDAGKFTMRDLEPGAYRLTVSRTGFAGTEYGARGPLRGGTTLNLSAHQRLTGIDFRLSPHAVITGRIVDVDGEPVANVSVSALRYRYFMGRRQLVPVGNAGTNDLGEYRIFGLASGRYYVSGTHQGSMFSMAEDRSAAPQTQEGYVPTYYPGTAELRSAALVDATSGNEIQQLNFRLSRSRAVRVRGRIINQTGKTDRGSNVMLQPKDVAGMMGPYRSFASGPEGQFELRSVPPGSYTLIAMAQDDQQRMISVRQSLEVGVNNVENVIVTISPGIELRGDVRAEEPGTLNLTAVRVALRPSDPGVMYGGMPGGTVSENGRFTLMNVQPDRYSVTVAGLPDGFYVQSIRMEEVDALESGLDLTRGAAGSLQIVLSGKAAQVEGAVTNEKQEPVAGSTVVLIPTSEKRREQFQFHKTVNTDQHGHFILKGLEPGEYKLFAWEDIENGAWMDPEVLQPAESKGKTIVLRQSSRESVDMRVIPAP